MVEQLTKVAAGVETGRESESAPATDELRAAWARAAERNDDRNVDDPRIGELVPVAAIKIVEDILPREESDPDAVERYAVDFANLPPVRVQLRTFVLIEGKQRIDAAALAGEDLIPIVELDPDGEERDRLWLRAFRENRAHGLGISMPDRKRYARRVLEAFPDWSDALVGEEAGISRTEVGRIRTEPPEDEGEATKVRSYVRGAKPIQEKAFEMLGKLVMESPEGAVMTCPSGEEDLRLAVSRQSREWLSAYEKALRAGMPRRRRGAAPNEEPNEE